MSEKLERRLIIIAVAVMAAFPGFHAIFAGLRGAFWYIATDSFYYLTIARNVDENGLFAFDKQNVTNGFHPLWQFLTIVLAYLSRSFEHPQIVLVWLTFVTCQLLFIFALTMAAWALIAHAGNARVLLLLLPFGIYAIIGWIFQARYSTQWDCINGMETSLSLAFMSLLLNVLLREKTPFHSPGKLGILAGLVILSRLDLVFLLPALGVCALRDLAHQKKNPAAMRQTTIKAAVTLAIAMIPILAYVLWNKQTFDTWLPVSGAQKSSFPWPNMSNLASLTILFTGVPNNPKLDEVFRWRVAQMFIPPILAIAYLMYSAVAMERGRWSAESTRSSLRRISLLACVWILGLHLYNILFVSVIHQGYWYYGASFLLLWIPAMHFAVHDPLFRALHNSSRLRTTVGTVLCLFQAVYFSVAFVFSCNRPGGVENELKLLNYKTFTGTEQARTAMNDEVPPLLEVDDGILAYSFNVPAISGIGLCLDIAGHRAIARGEAKDVLDLAWQRGVRHLAASNYMRDDIFYSDPSPQALTEHMKRSKEFGLSYADYAWSMVYAAPDRGFFIMRYDKTR